MARIRTIKPGFWTDEDLSALPEATHMLAASLLNYADDDGYFNANPSLVKAACCPLREPSVSIHDSLNLLAKTGWLKLGTGADGKRYGLIVTFSEHQRINRKTESKIKTISIKWDDFTEHSLNAHGVLSEASHPEGKGREGKGREGSAAADAAPAPVLVNGNGVIQAGEVHPLQLPVSGPPKPPKPQKRRMPDDFALNDALQAYAVGRGISVTRVADVFEHFRDHHRKLGSVFLDWDAAWRTWCRNEAKFNPAADKPERKAVRV